jgi:predicted unusual protein kinase regulating ubiquinone biosynthesis (AarF/ABC1/UbiB family)
MAEKDDIARRLLGEVAAIPTSRLGRLGRAAGAVLRGGRLARSSGELDPAALARIVTSLGELKGIAMKAGQLMSYVDIALPDELKSALAVLQTHSQAMPWATVAEIVRRDLGDAASELLAECDPTPIAAASIGQVHRARLADGTPVAVKVQYPEIERAIEADFGPTAVARRVIPLIYPHAKADAFIDEARARFLEECDYLHEARLQARFATLFAQHPALRVPAVHRALCSRHVLVTTFMAGAGFDAFLATDPDAATRDRIGVALFEFYVGTLFRHGLYNCDPHPGNYLFASDGAVVMLDYGCTREFDAAYVEKLARLTRAVHADTQGALHASFVELGMVQPGRKYDFATARDLVRAFYGPMLENRVQHIDLGAAMSMRRVIDGKRELMKLGIPGEFLFLFRIRFGLMSVLAALGARANWYELEESFVAAAIG